MSSVAERIQSLGVLPLFYVADEGDALALARALQAGGLTALEFTHRGEKAPQVFAALRREFPDLLLGIGSVVDGETARQYVDAGAQFIVSPAVVEDVAAALPETVPYLPGAQTVREVLLARRLGSPLVKLFPGEVLGPGFVKALRGPLPDIPVMVTGGVSASRDSLAEWFGAGVQAVGLGSKLIPKIAGLEAAERQAQLDKLTETSARLLTWAKELREAKES